jgi:serine/threonine-protein kinase
MAEPARANLIGQTLANTYRVESLLGVGGMGAVYLASHLRLPMKVAIKILHTEAANNPEIFARFRREAEIASGLRHPNIVQVYDFNHLPDGTPYLIMEFLEGEDLHSRLRARGRLSYPETAALCRAVGAGLQAAHKREVVHRDLKPQNIFLCRHEQGDEVVEVPKILDFGISKIRHAAVDTLKTQDQQLLGTPHYMSPEQARGQNSEVDARTDQWALGAILYQCLSGRLAFPGESLAAIIYHVVAGEPEPLRALCPDVPAAAVAAIGRALSKAREARYPSIAEFVRAFCEPAFVGAYADTPAGLPVPAGPGSGQVSPLPTPTPGIPTPGPGPGGVSAVGSAGGSLAGVRRRWLAVPLAAIGLGVIGLAAWGIWRGQGRGGGSAGGEAADLRQEVAAVADLLPAEVTVRVRAWPADAQVEIAGRTVAQGTALRLPRSPARIEAAVRAPGHVAQRIGLVPSSDQDLEVRLSPEPAPTGARPLTEEGRDKKRGDKKKRQTTQSSDADDVDLSGIK